MDDLTKVRKYCIMGSCKNEKRGIYFIYTIFSMTAACIQKTLLHLRISPRRSVLCGSGSVALRCQDFREVGDIDLVFPFFEFLRLWIFCGWKLRLPKDIWKFREFCIEKGGCEAFWCWKVGNVFLSYKYLKQHSHSLGCICCSDIDLVKQYKRSLHRDKDIRDLAFLRLHSF